MKKFLLFLFPAFLITCSSAPKNETGNGGNNTVAVDSSNTTPPRNALAQDMFRGEIRSEAKTSFVAAIPDTFESIKKLRKWLPDDEYMHKSTDAKHNNSPRTIEESHNVFLNDLYIFGVKKEDDNDYHLILASSKNLDKEQLFFSAEISGLPDSSSEYFKTLSSVRTSFLSFFGDDANREFVFVASEETPPIHLHFIKGSLFFDNHHYGGHSSVKGYQVCSAWEIHPVTAIGFPKKR